MYALIIGKRSGMLKMCISRYGYLIYHFKVYFGELREGRGLFTHKYLLKVVAYVTVSSSSSNDTGPASETI